MRLAPAAARVLTGALLSGCATAAAAPVPSPAAPYTPHPAVALVERLAASDAAALPSVVGQDLAAARRTLRGRGLTVQAVAFTQDTTVTAQYPAGLAPPPRDGRVTVWVGTPPEPPAAPSAAPATAGPTTPAPAPATPAPDPAVTTPVPAAAGEEPTDVLATESAEAGLALSGKASWYGPGFAGRRTACGTNFDPAGLTLASRDLPCGTRVRITGPAGASVDATVTDWGPAEWTGRAFDLSQATFEAIHHLGAGVIDVTVTVRD
jgi:rare lipoprotein A